MAQQVKNPPAMQEMQADMGSVPGWGRFPGEEHGEPLLYFCLENPMDRGANRKAPQEGFFFFFVCPVR